MTQVIVAHEKHGTFTYSTAIGLLKQRINDGYWYDGAVQEAAEIIAGRGDETEAWRFLVSRSEHEYEYVEKQPVVE